MPTMKVIGSNSLNGLNWRSEMYIKFGGYSGPIRIHPVSETRIELVRACLRTLAESMCDAK